MTPKINKLINIMVGNIVKDRKEEALKNAHEIMDYMAYLGLSVRYKYLGPVGYFYVTFLYFQENNTISFQGCGKTIAESIQRLVMPEFLSKVQYLEAQSVTRFECSDN